MCADASTLHIRLRERREEKIENGEKREKCPTFVEADIGNCSLLVLAGRLF